MRFVVNVAMCVMAALMGYQLRQLWSITQGCKLPGFSLVSQVNVSANSNREPTLGAETVRKNKTQEWLPENFLQPVDEEEVATKVPAPFYCDPFEHVLVINLEDDRGIGRRKHMMQQFKKAGIKKYNFFPAVDFKEDLQLKRELKRIRGLCQNPARCHHTLGCAMSHRRVYEKILYENWPCAMVFEDDAALSENFSQRIVEMTSGGLPPFDITLMGWCAGSKESKKKPATDQSSVPQMKNGWPGMCIHAYIISIYGALMMAQGNTPIDITPDAVLDGVHHHMNRTRTHLSRKQGSLQGSYWFTKPLLSWQDAHADGLGGGV